MVEQEKMQNNHNISIKTSHERLAEIGHILFNGIKRLKKREEEQNHLESLDFKQKRSVHGVSNNLNSREL